MIAYLFAGQGSQYIGMGKDLYESFPESKAIFEKADAVLGFSLSRLCFEGPKEELIKTNNSQPAILTVSIAALEALKSTRGTALATPGLVAGLSLGEYSALVAAGALHFEDAVYVVRRRGQCMEEEAQKKPGKMLSVIGLDFGKVNELCAKTNTEVANINCPGQVVVSGGVQEIGEAQAMAKEMGAKMALPLEVSGAFHSSFMEGASLKLARVLDSITIFPPKIPVVSNVTAQAVLTPEEIRENLITQIYSPVLWEDSMRLMLSRQVDSFYEFGPGKVLKGLMRRIEPSALVVSIEKKEDIMGLR